MTMLRIGDAEPVRHRFLDVALTEAIGSDVACNWYGIDRGRWTRVVANSILDS